MNNLLIVGAGSFATEIDELAKLLGYTEVAFIDDNPDKARCIPVVGTMKEISSFVSIYPAAIVALGNNELRLRYHRLLKETGFTIPALIHPTAYVSPDAVLSPGCIIRTHTVISRYAVLGEAVIVNIGGLVDHHCKIGEGSHILMGAVVRNCVTLEPLTWVPSNTVVE